MQHNGLYALAAEWFYDSSRKVKQGWLEKTNSNFSVNALSEKKSWFVFIFFLPGCASFQLKPYLK